MDGSERKLNILNWNPQMAGVMPRDVLKDVSPEEKSWEVPSRKQPHPAAVAAAAAGKTSNRPLSGSARITPQTPGPLTVGGSSAHRDRPRSTQSAGDWGTDSMDCENEECAEILVLLQAGKAKPEKPDKPEKAHKPHAPHKTKSTGPVAPCDRARPGPRPQSKFMGVTRHVKGMFNAQLWLAGQTRQEHVGGFGSTQEAAAAHDIAALTIKGPSAKTNFPKEMYDGMIDNLRGMDWPALRAAIKGIIKEKIVLPDVAGVLPPPPTKPPKQPTQPGNAIKLGDPGPASVSPPPAALPRKRSLDEIDAVISREGSGGSAGAELLKQGSVPSEATPEDAGAAPVVVRKSGRQGQVPGRLKALNGEDPKLGHAQRRKRKKKMDREDS